MRKTKSLPERFWSKVDKNGPGGCWLWTGAPTKTGYGNIWPGTYPVQGVPAHRMSWVFAYGPIPDDTLVLHKCDVRLCVRPDHLFLGTQADNMADMITKGRHKEQVKTHCKHGHEFTPENTYIFPNGRHRKCRACRNEWQRLHG